MGFLIRLLYPGFKILVSKETKEAQRVWRKYPFGVQSDWFLERAAFRDFLKGNHNEGCASVCTSVEEAVEFYS